MIVRVAGQLAGLLARCLLETAILFLAVGLLLGVAAFRVGRRLIVPGQDPLERLSGRAALLSSLIPRRPPQAAETGSGEEYGELVDFARAAQTKGSAS